MGWDSASYIQSQITFSWWVSTISEHRKQDNNYAVIKFVLHCVLPGSFAQGFVGGYHLLPKIFNDEKTFFLILKGLQK